MKRTSLVLAVIALSCGALVLPSAAQQDIALPDVCLAADPHAGHAMGGDDTGMTMGGDAAHLDLMDGMSAMNRDMMAGGTAEDIDVAFVCSMIPHHRGAIDMAKAELAHGDDPWARALAEAIIAAQEKEIAEMLAWLEAR